VRVTSAGIYQITGIARLTGRSKSTGDATYTARLKTSAGQSKRFALSWARRVFRPTGKLLRHATLLAPITPPSIRRRRRRCRLSAILRLRRSPITNRRGRDRGCLSGPLISLSQIVEHFADKGLRFGRSGWGRRRRWFRRGRMFSDCLFLNARCRFRRSCWRRRNYCRVFR
jgi:hypothetical protein